FKARTAETVLDIPSVLSLYKLYNSELYKQTIKKKAKPPCKEIRCKMKQTILQQNLIHSFWFLPTIFGIVSILLAVTAVNIDFLLSDEQLKAIAPSVLIPDGELTAKI